MPRELTTNKSGKKMEQENRYKQRKPTPLQINPTGEQDAVKLKDKDTSNSLPLSEILETQSANLSLPPSPVPGKSPFTFEFPVEAAK